ncbi:MAG: caspase family protein [Elusimicrobia bacterium]|nr:caspase family protein [Elusimicrobiota bacterium]
MKNPRILAAAVLAAAVSACSSLKNVASEGVQLCEGGACRALAEDSRADLARALYAFLRDAEGRELALSEAAPGERTFRGKGVRIFTQGGPISAVYKGKGMRITDVLYLDLTEGVIKFKARLRGTYLWVPVLCAEGSGTITVRSGTDARMRLSSVCTWVISGPMLWKWDGLIDRLEPVDGLIGMRYAIKGGGLIVAGGGSGYLLARAEKAGTAEKPEEPEPAKGMPVPGVSAAMTLDARLYAGPDSVIEAGTAFTLAVELSNPDAAAPGSVRLSVTGSPVLAAALPESEKDLGVVAPGQKATVSLGGTLGAETASQTASLRVEALGENGVVLAVKSFEVVLRGAGQPAGSAEASVDELPAAVGAGGPDDAALVVGVSRHKDGPAARYAERDAELMAKYLARTAGVPEANVKLLLDEAATKEALDEALTRWLPGVLREGSRAFVYFAGRGAPGTDGPALVPFDGKPGEPKTLLPLSAVTSVLAASPARRALVLLDAGGAAPAAVPASAGRRLAVLSAASGAQAAGDFDKAKHGLFTYALLKGLRGEADGDGDGKVSVDELFGYVSGQVTRRAEAMGREQTPVLLPEPSAGDPAFSVSGL